MEGVKRRNPMFKDTEATDAAEFKDQASYIRRGKFYLFGLDLLALREAVFKRSEGFCEMSIRGITDQRCNRNISFETMEMHHEPPKSKGGHDHIDLVVASCRRCHIARHGRTVRSDKADNRGIRQ
jgi:5-methylcytosine-specific restriction endonuclease McrA